jgi:hypothetical protein
MKLLREPLVHFLVLGLGLFVLFGLVDDSAGEATDRIEISAARVAQLTEIFTRTWQRPPTERELTGLIEDHVREEIYYREALAMGLDRDDTIVRRRLRQKLEFFTDDLVASADPTEEQLQEYLSENSDAFRIPARLTFRHVYFSRDRRGERAEHDAEALLVRLSGADAEIDTSGLGDSLMLPAAYGRVSEEQVDREFGAGFGAALAELPVGPWAGPVESGYGLHLVQIQERQEGSIPSLAEAREAVEREWQGARRKEAAEAFYRKLRERYVISIESPKESHGDENQAVAQAGP